MACRLDLSPCATHETEKRSLENEWSYMSQAEICGIVGNKRPSPLSRALPQPCFQKTQRDQRLLIQSRLESRFWSEWYISTFHNFVNSSLVTLSLLLFQKDDHLGILKSTTRRLWEASRRCVQNEYLFAKIGVDTAKNGLPKMHRSPRFKRALTSFEDARPDLQIERYFPQPTAIGGSCKAFCN